MWRESILTYKLKSGVNERVYEPTWVSLSEICFIKYFPGRGLQLRVLAIRSSAKHPAINWTIPISFVHLRYSISMHLAVYWTIPISYVHLYQWWFLLGVCFISSLGLYTRHNLVVYVRLGYYSLLFTDNSFNNNITISGKYLRLSYMWNKMALTNNIYKLTPQIGTSF